MIVFSGVLIACDCTGTILVDCGDVIERFNAPIAALELGLRWLHDRAEEDGNAALAEVILEKAPVVLNGLLSALAFDYAQKFAEIPRDAVHARELRKRWKNLKRNRLKKDIP